MIYVNGKEISVIKVAGKTVTAVYKGSVLVWQAVRSCFAKGYWLMDKGWSNEEGWKND